MSTVMVTGANRGLGLEFCRQYAAAGWHVIACCRSPQEAKNLSLLKASYSKLRLFSLDVTDLNQIDTLSKQLSGERIDILINNAGVYGDKHDRRFGKLDYQAWSETMQVNVFAPVKIVESFMTQLKQSEKKLVVTISSQMGSIADNSSGGSIFYRTSKAAINTAMKSLAIDLKEQAIGVLIFHPGWVKTDMGGSNALIDAQQSIAGMRSIIEQFSLPQTGSFIKYDGSPMPW